MTNRGSPLLWCWHVTSSCVTRHQLFPFASLSPVSWLLCLPGYWMGCAVSRGDVDRSLMTLRGRGLVSPAQHRCLLSSPLGPSCCLLHHFALSARFCVFSDDAKARKMGFSPCGVIGGLIGWVVLDRVVIQISSHSRVTNVVRFLRIRITSSGSLHAESICRHHAK